MIKNIILYFKNIFTKNKSFEKKMENIKKRIHLYIGLKKIGIKNKLSYLKEKMSKCILIQANGNNLRLGKFFKKPKYE